MIALQHAYWLFGLLLAGIAWRSARDAANPRRWGTTAFWGLLALGFLIGERVPAWLMGLVVIAIALISGFGACASAGIRSGRRSSAATVLRASVTDCCCQPC